MMTQLVISVADAILISFGLVMDRQLVTIREAPVFLERFEELF